MKNFISSRQSFWQTRRDTEFSRRDSDLAGQVVVRGQPAARQLHGRVAAEAVGVIAVLVASRNLQDPLNKQLPEAVADFPLLAGVGDVAPKAIDQLVFALQSRHH